MKMKLRYIQTLLFIAVINVCGFSQSYTIAWQRTIGGNANDKLTKTLQTTDGGLILCGYSNSNVSGDKQQDAKNGSYDFWVVKLTKTGTTQWSKTYGGIDRDLKPTIIQTTDGGFLLGGSSISPKSNAKSKNAVNQSFDYWVLKLSSSGQIVWDNTIGGIQFEKLGALLETNSGYFICGSSNSLDSADKTVDNEGSSLTPDYWIVKLNKSGTILWDSVYGGTNRDAFSTAVVTSDGGLLLAGTSYSPRGGNKNDDFIGNGDFWVIKLDSVGVPQWNRTIGGNLSENLTSVDLVGTIGYVFAGYSNSLASGNKTNGCKGVTDYWIVRADKFGNVLWNKTYGGTGADYLTTVKFLQSKYYVGGYSNSGISGDKTVDSIGGMDFWTMILDKNGNITEQNTWGGTGDDYLTDYFPSGTQYVLAGTSNSPKGKSKRDGTVGNTGNPDYWIFKISPAAAAIQANATDSSALTIDKTDILKTQFSLEINPNPVKDILHLNYDITNSSKNISLSIYSNNGKLIKQAALSNTSGTYTLDISNQASGLYYAVLQTGTSSATKKFIKN